MYLIYYENNDDLFHYKLTYAVTVSVTSPRKYENPKISTGKRIHLRGYRKKSRS